MKVCDMHCDTLRGVWAQEKGTKKAGFLENGFHVDLRKMAKGDYLLQCFAAFVDIKGTANPLVFRVWFSSIRIL